MLGQQMQPMQMPQGAGVAGGQPQPTAKVQPAGQGQPMADGEEATPEEQAIYDMVVKAAMRVMITEEGDPSFEPQILEDLAGAFNPDMMKMLSIVQPPIQENPIEALAVTGTMVALMAEAYVERGGVDVPNEVMLNAGAEIIEQLAEVSEGAKIAQYGDKEVEAAFLRAADIYRQISPRAQQNQAAMAQEFEELLAADKQPGGIEAFSPALGKLAASGGGQPPAPEQQGAM